MADQLKSSLSPAPRASVIVVTWNGRKHLPECLDSLREQSFNDFEVIVVDNGSTDGSLELLRGDYPWVRLVTLSENRGFAAGNNAGYAVARGAFIVLLNNDVRADRNWLGSLIAVAEERPDAGMVGSTICSYDDPGRIDSIGLGISGDCMGRGRHRNESLTELARERVEEILIPSACAALYRREMIDETGFFDDRFFAYCEDVDLGLRGRRCGWGAVAARDAVVYHKYSGSSGSFSPLKLYLVERNHYWAALKNFPLSLLLLLPFYTAARFFLQAAAVASGRGAGAELRGAASPVACAVAVLRGMLDALTGAPAIVASRARRRRRVAEKKFPHLLRLHRMPLRKILDLQ